MSDETRVDSGQETRVDPDALVGTMIDRKYRLEQRIGGGGMGIVYRAVHVFVGQNRAIKLLKPEMADDEHRKRFLAEPQLAAEIEHTNIIPVYDAGEEDGRPYVVMAYVDGIDLHAKLKREGKLQPKEALEICTQVAAALDAAHARGLVHRDVKPANVLIRNDGHVFLCDFGVAKLSHTSSGMTTKGMFIGTIEYAAPEQLSGKKIDGAVDQYALACVLYQCLAGETPYKAESSSELDLADAHRQAPPPKPSEHGLPTGLDPVFAKAMAKDPSKRYSSCAEFVNAASAVLGAATGERVPAVPPPPVRRKGETTIDPNLTRLDEGETTIDKGGKAGWKRMVESVKSRKPLLIGIVAGAGLLLAGLVTAIVLLATGGGSSKAAAPPTTAPPAPKTVTETVPQPTTAPTPSASTFPTPGLETTLYEAIPGRTRAFCKHGGFQYVRGATAAIDCHASGNWMTYGIYKTSAGALYAYNKILRDTGRDVPGRIHGSCPGTVPSNQSWTHNNGWVACWTSSSGLPSVISVHPRTKILLWGARLSPGSTMAELWAWFYNYGDAGA